PMSQPPIADHDLTLGLIAGVRARRLGGLEKAWLERVGQPPVLRRGASFAAATGDVLVSANRELARLEAAGLRAGADRVEATGPLAALDALSAACRSDWLFTLPVDLVDAPDDLLATLVAGRSAHGARLCDDDGAQPLVALWRTDMLRETVAAALAARAYAAHALQARHRLAEVRLRGTRLGNLNAPDALHAAGFQVPNP